MGHLRDLRYWQHRPGRIEDVGERDHFHPRAEYVLEGLESAVALPVAYAGEGYLHP